MSTQLLADALARDPHFNIIESTSNVTGILHLVKREKPHIAVVSAKLGESGHGSFELVREIRTQAPDTRVIVLLDSSDRTAVVASFRAGAQGIFCRTEPFRLLGKCIQCVHSGQIWASSGELHFVLEALAQPAYASFPVHSNSPLTPREHDVVRCVAEGLTNREIAQRLRLTEHTVKNYLFRIFDKLGVSSRVEVVLYALGNGSRPPSLVSPPVQSKPIPGKAALSPVAIRRTAT
jgi:DNA-binding NarL/FixJ family response regulator